jgi:hypothetical protein
MAGRLSVRTRGEAARYATSYIHSGAWQVSEHYILDGHKVMPCDLMTWARWFEKNDRRVAEDQIGDVWVSTVFLGLDHSFADSKPVLFETMIFGGEHDLYLTRCETWEEAEAMHAKAVALVRAGSSATECRKAGD